MADTLFGGLHEGVLVHRLYLTAGTEVLNTSPAAWTVTALDDDYIELRDVTVQQPLPYMVDHLPYGSPVHDHVTGTESGGGRD